MDSASATARTTTAAASGPVLAPPLLSEGAAEAALWVAAMSGFVPKHQAVPLAARWREVDDWAQVRDWVPLPELYWQDEQAQMQQEAAMHQRQDEVAAFMAELSAVLRAEAALTVRAEAFWAGATIIVDDEELQLTGVEDTRPDDPMDTSEATPPVDGVELPVVEAEDTRPDDPMDTSE